MSRKSRKVKADENQFRSWWADVNDLLKRRKRRPVGRARAMRMYILWLLPETAADIVEQREMMREYPSLFETGSIRSRN